MKLPSFPPLHKPHYLPSEETRAKDKQQKQVAQLTRAALADWFMSISEPVRESQDQPRA